MKRLREIRPAGDPQPTPRPVVRSNPLSKIQLPVSLLLQMKRAMMARAQNTSPSTTQEGRSWETTLKNISQVYNQQDLEECAADYEDEVTTVYMNAGGSVVLSADEGCTFEPDNAVPNKRAKMEPDLCNQSQDTSCGNVASQNFPTLLSNLQSAPLNYRDGNGSGEPSEKVYLPPNMIPSASSVEANKIVKNINRPFTEADGNVSRVTYPEKDLVHDILVGTSSRPEALSNTPLQLGTGSSPSTVIGAPFQVPSLLPGVTPQTQTILGLPVQNSSSLQGSLPVAQFGQAPVVMVNNQSYVLVQTPSVVTTAAANHSLGLIGQPQPAFQSLLQQHLPAEKTSDVKTNMRLPVIISQDLPTCSSGHTAANEMQPNDNKQDNIQQFADFRNLSSSSRTQSSGVEPVDVKPVIVDQDKGMVSASDNSFETPNTCAEKGPDRSLEETCGGEKETDCAVSTDLKTTGKKRRGEKTKGKGPAKSKLPWQNPKERRDELFRKLFKTLKDRNKKVAQDSAEPLNPAESKQELKVNSCTVTKGKTSKSESVDRVEESIQNNPLKTAENSTLHETSKPVEEFTDNLATSDSGTQTPVDTEDTIPPKQSASPVKKSEGETVFDILMSIDRRASAKFVNRKGAIDGRPRICPQPYVHKSNGKKDKTPMKKPSVYCESSGKESDLEDELSKSKKSRAPSQLDRDLVHDILISSLLPSRSSSLKDSFTLLGSGNPACELRKHTSKKRSEEIKEILNSTPKDKKPNMDNGKNGEKNFTASYQNESQLNPPSEPVLVRNVFAPYMDLMPGIAANPHSTLPTSAEVNKERTPVKDTAIAKGTCDVQFDPDLAIKTEPVDEYENSALNAKSKSARNSSLKVKIGPSFPSRKQKEQTPKRTINSKKSNLITPKRNSVLPSDVTVKTEPIEELSEVKETRLHSDLESNANGEKIDPVIKQEPVEGYAENEMSLSAAHDTSKGKGSTETTEEICTQKENLTQLKSGPQNTNANQNQGIENNGTPQNLLQNTTGHSATSSEMESTWPKPDQANLSVSIKLEPIDIDFSDVTIEPAPSYPENPLNQMLTDFVTSISADVVKKESIDGECSGSPEEPWTSVTEESDEAPCTSSHKRQRRTTRARVNITKRRQTHSALRCFCGRTFPCAAKLEDHTHSHTKSKPWVCPTCGKCFARQDVMRRHSRIHINHRPFKCTICKKCFQHKYELERHKRTHSGVKKFECNICHGRFSQKEGLRRHLETHQDEKPFFCNICRKKFVRKTVLIIHIGRRHKDIKNVCTECGKGYKSEKSLQAHLKVHPRLKKNQCVSCKGQFSSKKWLVNHNCPKRFLKRFQKKGVVEKKESSQENV